MNISLKNIKIARSNKESIAFSAEVLLDGEKVGTAMNKGYGGSNLYHIENSITEKKMEEYAKTLPGIPTPHGDIKMNLDVLIGDLVFDYEFGQKLKNKCKKITLFRLNDVKYGKKRLARCKHAVFAGCQGILE